MNLRSHSSYGCNQQRGKRPWGRRVRGKRYRQQQQPTRQRELGTVQLIAIVRYRKETWDIVITVYLHIGIGLDWDSRKSELIPSWCQHVALYSKCLAQSIGCGQHSLHYSYSTFFLSLPFYQSRTWYVCSPWTWDFEVVALCRQYCLA